MNEVLNKKVGGRQRNLTITGLDVKKVATQSGIETDKVILECVSPENQIFLIDEALLIDPKDDRIKPKGLWISVDKDGNIRANSTIALLLKYYNASCITDLIGKSITSLPKCNNYLTVVINSEITDQSLPW